MLMPDYEKLNEQSKDFDIKKNDRENKHVLLYIPKDTPRGFSLLRIVVENEDVKRVTYVGVNVQ